MAETQPIRFYHAAEYRPLRSSPLVPLPPELSVGHDAQANDSRSALTGRERLMTEQRRPNQQET